MAPRQETSDQSVICRAFSLAAESNELCRPLHLLAILSELDGPISDALRPPAGAPLFARRGGPPPAQGGGASYLGMQTRQAAGRLAAEREETVGPAHLLVAVIDQPRSRGHWPAQPVRP